MDRFIPNRSAMDFDFAHYMLTGGKVVKETNGSCSPAKQLYRNHLAEIFNMNRTRILAFNDKPPRQSEKNIDEAFSPACQTKSVQQRRHIPQSAERTLDAPDFMDDFYLNLLDWSSSNVIAVALGYTVYLWHASNDSSSELMTTNDRIGPVTSLKWAADGRHLAVGLDNSSVQLLDSSTSQLLRTLRGHQLRVSSLDWNDHILTTGGMDGMIINNDVRVRSHKISTYRGHSQEVCGLQWCSSGRQLASGGNDNSVCIWSASSASANSSTRWLHRFEDHSAAVKALSWCPYQSNLLASGGGVGDHTIRFWNSNTGACLNTVNSGSQVSSLLWSTHQREILSGHGFTENQLTLWSHPSMLKISELHGHTSRVLAMAKSPDGYTVASIAGDETLRLWNVFGTPQKDKRRPKKVEEPFPKVPRIR